MKIIILSFIFYFIINQYIVGQNFCICDYNNNEIFVGIDNRLTVSVDNLPCDSIVLGSNNGYIKRINCDFEINPTRIGEARIHIAKLVSGDTLVIGESIFQVKEIPKPVPKIFSLKEGQITKEELKAQKGIIAELESVPLQIDYKITSYLIIIIRQGKVILSKEITGNRFNNDALDVFNKLEKSDILLFSNIVVFGIEGHSINLQPIEFVVK